MWRGRVPCPRGYSRVATVSGCTHCRGKAKTPRANQSEVWFMFPCVSTCNTYRYVAGGSVMANSVTTPHHSAPCECRWSAVIFFFFTSNCGKETRASHSAGAQTLRARCRVWLDLLVRNYITAIKAIDVGTGENNVEMRAFLFRS